MGLMMLKFYNFVKWNIIKLMTNSYIEKNCMSMNVMHLRLTFASHFHVVCYALHWIFYFIFYLFSLHRSNALWSTHLIQWWRESRIKSKLDVDVSLTHIQTSFCFLLLSSLYFSFSLFLIEQHLVVVNITIHYHQTFNINI